VTRRADHCPRIAHATSDDPVRAAATVDSRASRFSLTAVEREPILALVGFTEVRDALRTFAQERDWEQFHTPKNLAMALAAEVGELIEVFQWLTPAESEGPKLDQARREAAADELADVVIYAVRLADVLGIDLDESVPRKIESNARRYPVDSSRGHAEKMP
jgi:dCTP diphosphatase